ncbi:MAG: GntR family transcriptional regulator [Sedimentisphaerales bacterium]|nr:GntR family transcriptional regulator [Sedimentisphaerales bacterium]
MLPTTEKKNASLAETVYNALRKRIVSGNLSPGDRITETSISTHMGISRAPVREALKRLAEDRLVLLVPYSGCYVAKPEKNEILEIYEIRELLETMALKHALGKFNLDNLRQLKQSFIDCEQLEDQKLIAAEVRLDTKLHNLIIDTSGFINLQEMLAKIQTRLQLFRVQTSREITRARIALQEHLRIIDGILKNDYDQAVQALQEHIHHTRDNMLQAFAVI